MTKSLYVKTDDTCYKLEQLRFGTCLKVLQSGVPQLAKAYSLIACSLTRTYQPVFFDILDSIGLWIDDSFYYIKEIAQEDKGLLCVHLFGLETCVYFPLSEKPVEYTTKRPMIDAVEFKAGQTNVFGAPNAFRGAYFTVTALSREGVHILKIDAQLPFCVQGDLVGVSEGYIEVYSDELGIARVYNCNCSEFNSVMARLPASVNVFLGDDCEFYISSLPLAESPQTLKVVDWKVRKKGSLFLTCCTLANELPFQLLLSERRGRLQIDMPRGYLCDLPQIKTKLLEDLT